MGGGGFFFFIVINLGWGGEIPPPSKVPGGGIPLYVPSWPRKTGASILCVTQKRAFMPLYIVLGQQRACMPVYIGKSGDLVG